MSGSNWSNLWKGVENVNFDVNKPPYIWSFYDCLLKDYDFKGKKILEFGCGTGINSLIMASRGAKLIFYDSSKQALELVKKNLDRLSLDAELVHGDVFDSGFEREVDICHSEGLVEHFLEPRRQEIVDIHARAAKKRGKVLIIIPHRKCAPYRIGKVLASKTGSWIYGNEYPYTKAELPLRLKRAGLVPGPVMGGEGIFSLFFLLSPLVLRSSKLIRKGLVQPASEKWSRLNYNNSFANSYGRVIGAVGEKV
jgi:2-polyprenyl-3-methyl-5-hydroxy-6-metoxy-1,4-benzoquinol methylase